MLAIIDFYTFYIMGSTSASLGGCKGRAPDWTLAFFELPRCHCLTLDDLLLLLPPSSIKDDGSYIFTKF